MKKVDAAKVHAQAPGGRAAEVPPAELRELRIGRGDPRGARVQGRALARGRARRTTGGACTTSGRAVRVPVRRASALLFSWRRLDGVVAAVSDRPRTRAWPEPYLSGWGGS